MKTMAFTLAVLLTLTVWKGTVAKLRNPGLVDRAAYSRALTMTYSAAYRAR